MDELDEIRKRKMQELSKKIADENRRTPAPITVTDQNFDQVVSQNALVVVDCWAPWCGPCRIIAPLIDELANDYAGRVVFGKLNVDENPRTTSRFGIMSIPTLLFIKNRIEVERIVGAAPRGRVEAELRKYL